MVRMKNYKFTSINDVFEGRDNKDKDLIHQNVNANQKANIPAENL